MLWVVPVKDHRAYPDISPYSAVPSDNFLYANPHKAAVGIMRAVISPPGCI